MFKALLSLILFPSFVFGATGPVLYRAQAPLTLTNGLFARPQASSSQNGYLSSADWTRFDAGAGSAIGGSATANRVAFGSAPNTLTSDAGFTYDGTTFGTRLAMKMNEAGTSAAQGVIYNEVTDGSLIVSGGSSASLGGNILLAGESEASNSTTGSLFLRNGTTIVGRYRFRTSDSRNDFIFPEGVLVAGPSSWTGESASSFMSATQPALAAVRRNFEVQPSAVCQPQPLAIWWADCRPAIHVREHLQSLCCSPVRLSTGVDRDSVPRSRLGWVGTNTVGTGTRLELFACADHGELVHLSP
jgi:hypothetical protein